ncbi:MAG: LytTR family DNA-binding domain-containing protein [Acidobacteria bacterium]|nr:LytTR family DNA-binding domain-containing protein [Acidobacteriota bacterium]
MRVYLVDDEPLALQRLARMLGETGRVEIAGSTTNPEEAVRFLTENPVDAVFLDIQMPALNGFEVLARLEHQPSIVFTTAFDQFALRAFDVNSVDYLLKPVTAEHLDRALNRLERLVSGGVAAPSLSRVLTQLLASVKAPPPAAPDRIASRSGDRIEFIELNRISHFYSEDKLTFAATPGRNHVVDQTIGELEQRLESRGFFRIHRATLVNLRFVHELHTWFAGRMVVRLNNEARSELTVARDRVKLLKDRLGA